MEALVLLGIIRCAVPWGCLGVGVPILLLAVLLPALQLRKKYNQWGS